MQINIHCEYCGTYYDANEHPNCPNCAAVPTKKQISAARAAAKAESKAAAAAAEAAAFAAGVKHAKGRPTGALMRGIIMLIPLWIAVILIMPFIPSLLENKGRPDIAEYFQVVDEPVISEHAMNETFDYDGAFAFSVDSAVLTSSEVLDIMLPENMKILAVHVNSSYDKAKENGTDYFYINIYYRDGGIFRKRLSGSALDYVPEKFKGKDLILSTMKYYSSGDGYIYFIVDKDVKDPELCIEKIHKENGVTQLDLIHSVKLEVTED